MNIIEQLKDGKKALNEIDYTGILVEVDEETRGELQKTLLTCI